MIKIGNQIVEDGISLSQNTKYRYTVRAIVYNLNHEVLLLHSKLFNDYTFPGGGMKAGESHETALTRELHEELGATKINIIKPYGYTEELRHGIKGNDHVYLQISYYYIVEIISQGAPNYVAREIEQGLSSIYMNIDEAITHNLGVIPDELHQTKGLKTVLPRENMVLKHIKENLSK